MIRCAGRLGARVALALFLLSGCSLPLAVPPLALPTTPAEPLPVPPPSPTAVPSPTAAPTPAPTPTFEQLLPTPTLAPITADARQAIFEQAWNLVHRRYLYPDYHGVDWPAVRDEFAPQIGTAENADQFYQLMHAMIDRLGDDHTHFESPQEVAEEEARSAGELTYGGIGVTIRDDTAGALVTRLAAGSPAERAGIQLRDLIIAIGGVPISDTAAFGEQGPEGAVRGTPGTVVRLLVGSPGATPRELSLTREVIPADAFPPAEGRRIRGTRVGLLLIDTFDREDLVTLVRDQLDDLLAPGPLTGLIIDVRDNGGGYIDVMLDILALFVDGGSIGSSSSRRGREDLEIPGGQVVPGLADLPIVVLTSDGTASAAEMFAAGMRVRQRATMVGTTTAGNTENLVLHNFSDGSRLWLAEYAYRLPNGELIEGVGVAPDRLVAAKWWRFDPADDPQVQAALAALGVQSPASRSAKGRRHGG